MLEGAVPGVQLTTATNQPGTDAAIYVRGVGSLKAGTGALIVLDGSPYQGSLSDINPADIESISVSKDATNMKLKQTNIISTKTTVSIIPVVFYDDDGRATVVRR